MSKAAPRLLCPALSERGKVVAFSGGWGMRRPLEVSKPAAEIGQGTVPLPRIGDQVFIGVEDAAVQVADGGRQGELRREQRDAGRERAGGVGQDRPDERLGIADTL